MAKTDKKPKESKDDKAVVKSVNRICNTNYKKKADIPEHVIQTVQLYVALKNENKE